MEIGIRASPGNCTGRKATSGAGTSPYSGKTVFYYSGWTNAGLLYQCGTDTNLYNADLNVVGPGRTPGECLYHATNLALAGELITFVPHGFSENVEYWDHPAIPGQDNYSTPLDVFLLQDGHVYNYVPPNEPATSRMVSAHITSSWDPTIPSRDIRIYLPRHYDANTNKHYPVLYLHDGQNVFPPGGVYGCWYAEVAADQLIALGMMSETILVGVDNTDERLREYVPPTDDGGYGPGTANLYMRFLLDNVKPHLDIHYRTLPDEAHTATLGSSFGGMVSAYLGLATNRFGRIGPMSPSFWACPNFVDQCIRSADTSGRRIYMDCGTLESTESMWNPMWEVYNEWMADGYSQNGTLLTLIGCEQGHTESAWAMRITNALCFLMDIRLEANELARLHYPPALLPSVQDNNAPSIAFNALNGTPYLLQRAESLTHPNWQNIQTNSWNNTPWTTLELTDNPSPPARAFYRVLSLPPSN